MHAPPPPLSDIVAALVEGRSTPRELAEASLAAIAAQTVNAVVETGPAVHDGFHGPLAGAPVTIKEAIGVRGFRSTWGLPDFADHVAEQDAPAVARLRAAGANIIGTTNVATMLADFGQTDNDVHGSTLNPWDPTRTPGGSSGGAAAAVAAGLSPLDLGTDLSGSIRIPAAFCGVLGLKPTPGTVPMGFHPPMAPDVSTDLDFLAAVGPITRTAADMRLAFSVLSGRRRADERTRPLRIGLLLEGAGADPDDVIVDALDRITGRLSVVGIRTIAIEGDEIDPELGAALFGEAVGRYFAAKEGDEDRDLVAELLRRRTVLTDRWARLLERVDAVLMPVTPITAPHIDARPVAQRTVEIRGREQPYDTLASWTAHATIAGLPALSVPIGRDPAGLPIGAQLVAAPHHDHLLIDLAEIIARL